MFVADRFRDRGRDIELFLSEWMQSESAPGVSIAVVENGELAYANGLGSRNLERNLPATEKTLYGIASCSKSFTATGIMQLAEQGKLDVEDPISDHLPVNLWSDLDEPVTVHNLLTHSSGFPGDGVGYLLIGRKVGLDPEYIALGDMEDLYRFLEEFEDERAASPGERYFYFNSGWNLLGEVLSHHSGMPYNEYVQENILEPLGMERSTFQREDVEGEDDVLTPYLRDNDGNPQPTDFPYDDLTHAAGGMLSSVNELADYLRMYLNGGELNGQRILMDGSIERMTTGYIDWTYGMSASENEYGYGWSVKNLFDEKVVSHIGDLAVSSAYLGFSPTADIGVAITSNISPEYILQSVGEAVFSLVLGGDPYEDVPFFSVREKLDRLVGEYETFRGVLAGEVTRNGTVLQFSSTNSSILEFTLIPETPNPEDYRFYTISEEGQKKPLTVDVDEAGNVNIYIGRWRLHKR